MFSMFVRFVDIGGIVDHHCLSSQLMIKVRSIERLIHSPCVWFNVIMLSFFFPEMFSRNDALLLEGLVLLNL